MPYSEKILKSLQKEKIEIGDKFELASGDFKVVGELMPKTEVGDQDTYVIKLDNGYNVGIRHSTDSKVKLVSKGDRRTQVRERDHKGEGRVAKGRDDIHGRDDRQQDRLQDRRSIHANKAW